MIINTHFYTKYRPRVYNSRSVLNAPDRFVLVFYSASCWCYTACSSRDMEYLHIAAARTRILIAFN